MLNSDDTFERKTRPIQITSSDCDLFNFETNGQTEWNIGNNSKMEEKGVKERSLPFGPESGEMRIETNDSAKKAP